MKRYMNNYKVQESDPTWQSIRRVRPVLQTRCHAYYFPLQTHGPHRGVS